MKSLGLPEHILTLFDVLFMLFLKMHILAVFHLIVTLRMVSDSRSLIFSIGVVHLEKSFK
jgi:hypothetical protein